MWKAIETEEFAAWYEELDLDAQEDVFEKVEVLRQVGPQLGRPQVDSVKGSRHSNMKELRVQSKGRPFRIFFAFDPKRQAVLLIGGNKEGDKRFYEKMIPMADALFGGYLEQMAREEKETKNEKRKRGKTLPGIHQARRKNSP